MNRKPISGRAGYDIEATPATEFGEHDPIVFLSMTESGAPLSASKGVEDELTIPAAKALIAQLQDAVRDVETEHDWTEYPGHGGTLKVNDLITIEDDPLFNLYVEQEDQRTFTLSFSQAEKLIEQLSSAMTNYRGSDRRPTPQCPSWCNAHRDDCEGMHFGRIVINHIEIEIEWDDQDPNYGDPRVDIGGYGWASGGDLADLAEALHVAECFLAMAQRAISITGGEAS